MVLIAAAICSKEGKALVSRQFVEMSKPRIEGLIATFPKLVDSDKQHTFIETDSVRYVYQPLEKMYVLLITTKASNILEDLETLRLFARVIPEYARGPEVSDVVENAFQIIFAFDEIVALGYRESVTLSQIRTFTEMDSHDERIFNAIRETQEKDAKELSRRKARELQQARLAAAKQGVSPAAFMSAFGEGGGNKVDPYIPQTTVEPKIDSFDVSGNGGYSQTAAGAPIRRGMQLGGRSGQGDVDKLTEMFRAEAPSIPAPLKATDISHGSITTPMATVIENLHVKIEEKLTVHAGRDGGLELMELAGVMQVRVGDEEASAARILIQKQLSVSFQTHPNLDKSVFQSSNWLQIKSGGKNFPVGQEVGVLKWRLQSQDEADLPVIINCWPNEIPGGFEVNIEYELQNTALSLQNFCVTIPLPSSAKPPLVGSCDGDYEINARHSQLLWTRPIVDKDNATGSLEFTIKADRGAKADLFFPIQLNFCSSASFCGIQVLEATDSNNTPLKHSCEVNFHPDRYEIV